MLNDPVLCLFLIIIIGLLVGRIRVRGNSFGIAGVLLVGLAFGHFGASLPGFLTGLGMVLFVSALGFQAGAGIRGTTSRLGAVFVVVPLVVLGVALAVAFSFGRVFNLETALSAGMMMGAVTSTPGLGAALEAVGQNPLVGIGYAITYPLGVLGVVGLVNIFVRGPEGRQNGARISGDAPQEQQKEPSGANIFLMALVIVAGIYIGKISIPLPWVGNIHLGLTGGPLVAAIAFGYKARIGPLVFSFPLQALLYQRDLGAVIVLAAVGVSAGGQFIDMLSVYGLTLLAGGVLVTIFSTVTGFLATRFFALSRASTLGVVTGSMTSMPGLAVALEKTTDQELVLAYASAYPVAVVINCVFAHVFVLLY